MMKSYKAGVFAKLDLLREFKNFATQCDSLRRSFTISKAKDDLKNLVKSFPDSYNYEISFSSKKLHFTIIVAAFCGLFTKLAFHLKMTENGKIEEYEFGNKLNRTNLLKELLKNLGYSELSEMESINKAIENLENIRNAIKLYDKDKGLTKDDMQSYMDILYNRENLMVFIF